MAGQEQLLAALETERRRLEVILRQMPAMVVVFDASGRIVRANDQYLAAIGLPADQVVGRDPRDLPLEVVDEAGQVVPTADLPSTRALLGEDATAELGIRWPSGLRWLQVSAAPIRADDGTIEGAVLTLRDITAEREAAASLRASEAQHRALLDALPDSLYRIDRAGVVLERRAPDDGRAILHETYIGCSLVELLGEEVGGALTEHVRRALDSGETYVFEYQRPGPVAPYHREARIVALGPNEALALVRDIGERKRAEREHERLLETIERDRRRLDEILQQMPNPVIVFDSEGRIVVANDALIAGLNMSREQVLGKTSSQLGNIFRTPEGRPMAHDELPSSRAIRGEKFDGELRVERRDGRRGWLHVSAAPVRDEHGRITGVILATRDVTPERQAREALRVSEERNRALLNAIPDSIYVQDRDGVVLDFKLPSDGRPMLLDASAIGKRVDELFPSDIAALTLRMTHDALDSGQIQTHEYEVPTPVGPAWREARVVPCGDDRILALVRDIHARKRAEQERERLMAELDSERRRLAAILRQIPHSLLVLDREARIVDLNDGLVATIGLPKADLLGRRSGEVGRTYITAEGRRLSREELPSGRALRGEEVECELGVLAADGSRSWIQVSAAPVRDDAGTIRGAVVATRDVTAERDATAALRASELTNRALLDAMPDSLYRLARDGTILSWKPSPGLQTSDFLPRDFQGYRVDQIVPTDVGSRLLEAIHTALDSDRPATLEYELHAPDVIGYREARIVRVSQDEVLGLVRDIGDRKRAELALKTLNEELEQRVRDRTAMLEAANAELEAFSYSVSHDLKAPLRGIDGYSRLLWEDYQDRLDDDGRFLLESVRQGAAQMHQLIDDLLAYSRLERRTVDDTEIDLLPILEGLLAERAEEIRARSVRVDLTVPQMAARADRDGFAQAFRNLLGNALRFTADIPEPRIEIGGTVEPARCVLWIRDNGIGFDMQYHDRIFEIFQRLHRQEEYPGTGIGLALVRKAMQRMGGRVWAESSPGAGATFFLELPR